jgi:hypothetical protein
MDYICGKRVQPILPELVTVLDHQAFPILSIRSASYTFRTSCSAHKLDTLGFELKE